jgi:hypothetical protein
MGVVGDFQGIYSKKDRNLPLLDILPNRKEIGEYFAIGESCMSQTSRRVSDRLKTDKTLKETLIV